MKNLTAQNLEAMLDREHDLHLVNVLPAEQFDEKHIPGSVDVPVQNDSFVERVERLVEDKGDTVVVYCASQTCDASPQAAEKLEQEGFRDVYDFAGGVQAWEDARYPLVGTAT